MTEAQIHQLIDTLGVPDDQVFETHISWVLLSGSFAYKIKKPVKFTFLDFSTTLLRYEALQREFALNRRLAKELYIGVMNINEYQGVLEISDKARGSTIDHCLKMVRMDPGSQMDHLLRKGNVTNADIQRIADKIGEFHKQATVVDIFDLDDQRSKFNDIGRISHPDINDKIAEVIRLGDRFEASYEQLLNQRTRDGFVRDIHGDLTSKNIFLSGEPVIFDCIEFDDSLRQIDVLSDVGFFMMDMIHLSKPHFAQTFKQHYARVTGFDLSGNTEVVLNYYIAYRANVRAKINCLSLNNEGADMQALIQSADRYLDIAIDHLTMI